MTALREKRQGGVPARSRSYYTEALQEYLDLYGELTAACFAPASAKRNGRPDLVERYYKGRPRPDGSFPAGTDDDPATPWPSLNSIKHALGGFDNARRELGLEPNSTGPTEGRRKPGEAEPILNVRERRVVIPDASTSWLDSQLGKARRRIAALEAQLDRAKAKLADDSQVVDLRKRLQDEASRRRELARAKHGAEVRERARMREVERLTERLADLQARGPKTITKTVTKTVPGAPRAQTKVVTRTVKVQDAALLQLVERLEARVTELRGALSRSEAAYAEVTQTLAGFRREAVADALATQRVRSAERRVAEVEKKLAAQGELLVGERRVLSDAEVERLRTEGEAGEVPLMRAIKRVARARAEGAREALKDALTDVISAALNWRDRL